MREGEAVQVALGDHGDGEVFSGVVVATDQVSINGESRERLTVKRDDYGNLTYVVPDAEGITVTSMAPAQITSSPDQAPKPSQAPGIGVFQAGVPIAPAVAPTFTPLPASQPAPPKPEAPAQPERFMLQSTGKPSRYHTRKDCGKVPSNARIKAVDDEDIDFFELEQCAFCAKRDGQVSWREVIESIVGEAQAAKVAATLAESGFRVSPEVVDR